MTWTPMERRSAGRHFYILRGKLAVPCDDRMEWARWFETTDRKIASTKSGPSKVSTVFLGMDHRWGPGAPLLFETMVFGGPLDGWCLRTSSWAEAERQHEEVLAALRENRDPVFLDED